MIQPKLISTIVKLTIESEKFERKLLEQVGFLTKKGFEHTRVGLYVYWY